MQSIAKEIQDFFERDKGFEFSRALNIPIHRHLYESLIPGNQYSLVWFVADNRGFTWAEGKIKLTKDTMDHDIYELECDFKVSGKLNFRFFSQDKSQNVNVAFDLTLNAGKYPTWIIHPDVRLWSKEKMIKHKCVS